MQFRKPAAGEHRLARSGAFGRSAAPLSRSCSWFTARRTHAARSARWPASFVLADRLLWV